MLIHGDCLEVLPTLKDGSVDMVFADLPYGVTANRWDSPIDLCALWKVFLRVGAPNATFVFTASQPFTTTLVCSCRELFKYDLVWQKSRSASFLHAKHRPMCYHETVLVFARKKCTYNPQMVAASNPRRGKTNQPRGQLSSNYGIAHVKRQYDYDKPRHPKSIIFAAQGDNKNSLHPTQKPVTLLEWLIRTYTNEGDTVLDPTCGSGTTAIAAINTNRKWVCIEKDADYHAAAAKRIAEHQIAPRQGALAL